MARDTVQEIKERLGIQDVVAPYVKLTKAGRSLVGLCPFHKEKTGSFHVSIERGSWHCFGCGEGGDAFSFIEKIEGVDFKGALKILAEKAGVQVEHSHGGRERSERLDRLREAMARAAQWYAAQLNEGRLTSLKSAYEYARGRGLSDDTIRAWELGYAPDAWRSLLEALTAEGFTIQELLAAGLIKEADGKPGTYYDRFRNRLMFPIRDASGRVVAFTGRTLDSGNAASEVQVAKYLNSPETDLFHKSELLFGMDKAKDAIRRRGFALLVEGQMDVLLAHQTGWGNAVALSGTALSEKHLALLKRYSENLMLVLDADPAGLKATARSAELALHNGITVKAVRLPAGKDPADLISEDEKKFSASIAAGKPVVEFFLIALAEQERDPRRLIASAERVVLPLVAALRSPMEREYFIQAVARSLGLSSEAVRESLRHLPRIGEANEGALKYSSSSHGNKSVRPPAPARSARDLRGELLLSVMHAYPDTSLASRVKMEYCRITEAEEPPSISLPEPALFQAEQLFGENPGENAADELLRAFESAVIREAHQEATARLRKAEAEGDAPTIEEAQAACAVISARLSALG